MSEPVIRIENLSKVYNIGASSADSLREGLTNTFNRLVGRIENNPEPQRIWALKGINLEVQQGEVLGIIGHNGAGKSTLLKILSRITHPTTGRIEMKGRVSSLLEVGTGFHPELTGRENIYMNAAILGMKREETRRKFDEIVDFAEVEKFIDTPVKRYSSGMYTRLAFSVAAHLDPEILIVDEVLSVGDAAFQKKSLGKMQDVAGKGRTVLFVSHNLASIRHLCGHSILLSKGEIVTYSQTDKVLDTYMKTLSQASLKQQVTDISFPQDSKLPMQIVRVRLLDSNNNLIKSNRSIDKKFTIEISYQVRQPIQTAYVACQFDDSFGNAVLWTYDGETTQFGTRQQGSFVTKFTVPKRMFRGGAYHLHCMIVDTDQGVIHYPGIVFTFNVIDTESLLAHRNIRWPAIVGYNPIWETKKL